MKILFTCIIIFVAQLLIAQTKEYQITPELTKTISDKKGLNGIQFYEVKFQEVDFPKYKKGLVLTKYYQEKKEELTKYRSAYNNGLNEDNKLKAEFIEIKSIVCSLRLKTGLAKQRI